MIISFSCPNCPLCGTTGKILYRNLEDVLFDVSGKWNIRRCENCGLLWIDPMPLPEEIHKAYRKYPTHWDDEESQGVISKLYRKAQSGYRAIRFDFRPTDSCLFDRLLGFIAGSIPPVREQMDFPFEFFSEIEKGRLLELGCGRGDTLRWLQQWGWVIEGVDFDQAAVANAKAKGLPVRQGDLFSYEYPEGSFDVVFSSHVIEHVPDPISVVAECYRILAPGGCCIAVTPNAESFGHGWFNSDWRGLEPPRHLHIFTLQSLTKLAGSAGFSDFRLYTSTRLASSIYLASIMIRKYGKVFLKASSEIKLRSIFFHFAAYFLHRSNGKNGEELIFIGYK